VSRHKKHHPSTDSFVQALEARIDRARSEGRFQQALELARQLYKQEPSAAHLELLKAVSLGRARQLHEQKYDRDALSMLEAARAIDPRNPSWLQIVAELMALCGGIQQSLALQEQLPEGADQGLILVRAADAAIQQQAAGRAALPAALHADFDRVLQAFREIEAGQDEQAKNTLQGISLRSPFLQWKLFLRGLQAYSRQDDPRGVENWQRLDPDGVPARLAAPLRFQIDPAYRAAQPPATQALLQKKVEQVSSTMLATHLRQLRTVLANKSSSRTAAFRQLDTVLPILRQQAPQMVPRLARCFYWMILDTGPEDMGRYQRVFGPPPDDPHFHRLQALAYEDAGEAPEAHLFWQQYQKDLAVVGRTWPPGEVERARALIWLRMGKNAAEIPSKKKQAQLPPFLRDSFPPMPPLKPPAEKCFQESLKLAPDLLEAHEALFLHERDEDRVDKAIKAAHTLLEHFPDHVPTLERLTDLLLHEDRFADALAMSQRALKNNPLNRQLREKVGTVHMYCAREAAERDRFAEAREHYRQALEIDPTDRALNLCKWAVCEFKAGDAARAEELIQEAHSTAVSELWMSYHLLIEVLRFDLERTLKTRFEKEFKAGLALPPTAAEVVALLQLTRVHHSAETDYPGRPTHVKKVLAYAEKARKTVTFPERELGQVCQALVDLGGGVRSIKGFLLLGQREFPHNPLFPYLEAMHLMKTKKKGRGASVHRTRYLIFEADRLARGMPEGPEKEAMLKKIEPHKQAMSLVGPFGGFPMDGFFDMFDEDDDYLDDPD
jgi:tetratricopeptide (TPR) repeat protein